MNQCPECGKTLLATAKRCSCGWVKVESNPPTIADHKCHYAIGQRRCLLPGTVSPKGKAWYCRRHNPILCDPRLAEAALSYIEENYQKIMNEEYPSWQTSNLINNKF